MIEGRESTFPRKVRSPELAQQTIDAKLLEVLRDSPGAVVTVRARCGVPGLASSL
jgi:hypothetical protein